MSGTLCNCGCCTGLQSLSPESNAAGQPALSYRLGTYAVFLQRMLSQIASPNTLANPPEGPWTIANLTTRSDDDPTIALIDAWSVVLDVLTFYQERIANEGFLRTATEHRSVLELARAIGYELNPGVSAGTYLSFIIEDVIGTPSVAPLPTGPKTPSAPTQGASTYSAGIVTLPQGTQVVSVPPQGQTSQTFETSAELDARTEWNLMLPRITRPADFAYDQYGNLYLLGVRASFPASAPVVTLNFENVFLLNPDTPSILGNSAVPAIAVEQIYLMGTNTGIAVGDLILLLGQNPLDQPTYVTFQVRNVVADNTQGVTRIDFSDSPATISFSPAQFPGVTIPSTPVAFNQANVATYVLDTTIEDSNLQALMSVSNWDPDQLATMVNTVPTPNISTQGIFAFSSEATFFGGNAPQWKNLTNPSSALRGDAFPQDWDAANNGLGTLIWTDSQGNFYRDATAYLDRAYTGILTKSWVVIEAPGTKPLPLQVTAVADKSLADYGLTGKSTGLALQTITEQTIFSPAAPTLVSAFSQLFILANGSDGNLYDIYGGVDAWGVFEQVVPGSFAGGVAVITTGPTPMEAFFIGTNGSLHHAGSSYGIYLWWGPLVLGGALTGTPSVITGAPNDIDVLATGLDGNLYHFWYYQSKWNGPELHSAPSGIKFINSPAATGHGPSTTEVFSIGSDGKLYHTGWTLSTGWWGPLLVENAANNPPMNYSVKLVGSPTAGVNGLNPLDVFAIGVDGNLLHAWYYQSQWNGLENLGGDILVGSPCVVTGGPHNLEVFAIGADGNLYDRYWSGGSWSNWSNLGGGILIGSPSAISSSAGTLDATATGTDGNLYHFWYNGSWNGPELIYCGYSVPIPTRKSKVHIQSAQQLFAEIPVTDDVEAGTAYLMLNGLVTGLTPGQAIAVTGYRSDSLNLSVSEVVLLVDVQHIGGYTQLEFEPPGLTFSYARASMTLNANTVAATHGATIAVPEVLGSGTASQINQSFTPKRSPITYVPAATATGAQSTLQVQVNNLIWQQEPSLFGLGPTDRAYIARQNDDGTTTVTFGDGATGGLLPTGQNNVTATYRVGLGTQGNLPAGSLSVLQSRPPGLRGVNNPVPASGGADPENLASARGNAPRTVLTIDRIVSISDYQDFAATFAGIGKAQAIQLLLGQTPFIHLTVAGIGGTAIDPTSQLALSLSTAINAARDPLPQVVISSYQPVMFNIAATIVIDETDYIEASVHAQVVSTITAYFAFDQRTFAQPVTAAEVVATIQAVPGVVAVDLNQLYRDDDATGPAQTAPDTYLPAAYAQVSAGVILAAELLLLNPIGFSLTDKKQ
jgi:hypothetical protein